MFTVGDVVRVIDGPVQIGTREYENGDTLKVTYTDGVYIDEGWSVDRFALVTTGTTPEKPEYVCDGEAVFCIKPVTKVERVYLCSAASVGEARRIRDAMNQMEGL